MYVVSTGVTLFDPFPMKRGTTLEAFSKHWTGRHAQIASKLPEIRYYVQNHRVPGDLTALAPLAGSVYDGASQTWYTGAASLMAMLETPACRELLDDEGNFLELGRPRFPVLARTHEVSRRGFDPDDRGVKLLLFARRAPGVTTQELTSRWLSERHRHAGEELGVTRHAVSPAVPENDQLLHPMGMRGDADAPYDAVRELWWKSVEDVGHAAERAPGAWATLLHGPGIDVARSFALLVRETVIIEEPTARTPTRSVD